MNKNQLAEKCFKILNPHLSNKNDLEYYLQPGKSQTITAFLLGFEACEKLNSVKIAGLNEVVRCHSETLAKVLSLNEKHEVRIKELTELADPYCTVCGSCGEEGCCAAQKCRYPEIKSETIIELKDYIKELEAKLAATVQTETTKQGNIFFR